MPYRGPYCSEVVYVPGTHPPPEDCVAAAGIDMGNAATGGAIPATAREREALRVDSGDTAGGMDLAHLRSGMFKRYGLLAAYLGTLDAVQDRLAGGFALVILGWLDAVPKRYWMQKGGKVYHAMAFNEGDRPAFVHLSNPLAPAGHPGWEVPISVALDFARSSGSGRGGISRGIYALSLREHPQSSPIETPMPVIVSRVPVLVDLAVGDDLLNVDGKPFSPPLKVSVPQQQLSPWAETLDVGGTYRLVGVTTGGKDRPALLHATPTNTHPVPVPTPTPGDCSGPVAAEHERTRQAAIDAVTAIK